MGCYCSSEVEYERCCGAIIEHRKVAATPLELMKSRYSAYVIGDGEYLVFSAKYRYENDKKLIEEFSNSVEWLGLKILQSVGDIVEFKAYYRDAQGIKVLHERSNFECIDGVYKYVDGKLFEAKVQRNEPCPCGSTKKFKKCCYTS